MTGLEYLNSILVKYAVSPNLAESYRVAFLPLIQEWAGNLLVDLKISGSSRKSTAVSNGTDVDLFISLTSTTQNTLNEIYESLFAFLSKKSITVRRQNVSIGVTYNGQLIDLVPARRQGQFGNDHSLYVSKMNTWTKTNIEDHISTVSGSGRQDEFKILKIWRNQKSLDFPSFYLELVAIDALYGCTKGETDTNVMKVLKFIAQNIESRKYVDPANSNNTISDQLTSAAKKVLASAADLSSKEQYWSGIVS